VFFDCNYCQSVRSEQFAVATINEPNNLLPCGLVMNDDQNPIAPSTNNYLAYTPRPSPNRPNGQQHAETRIILNYDTATQGVTVRTVYLVTHYNPCPYCSTLLQNFVRNHPHVTFYIGYVQPYQNTLNTFIDRVGNEGNVEWGQITPTSTVCHDELRRRSTSCAVGSQCGGSSSGCFPANALVNINELVSPTRSVQDLNIGDEVLTMSADGKLLYSPIVAFLDRAPLSMKSFLEVVTEDQHKLQLTPTHLIFTNDSSKPVYASDVQIGSYVYTLGPYGHSVQLSKVTSVDMVSAVGMYAPLTKEGTVIVDGILASCYAEINAEQSDIHSLFGLLRFFYSVTPQMANKNQNTVGIHWYARTLMQLSDYMKEYLPNALLPGMIAN